MDLGDYLKILRKSVLLIVIVTVAFVAVVAAVVGYSKPRYESNITLTVDRPNTDEQEQAAFYTYDDYYSLQSSSLIADTVINWLQSPSIVQSIYNRAGIQVPTVRNVALLGKIFTVKKYQPATLSITFRSPDSKEGVALLQAATTELQERSKEFTQQHTNEQVIIHSTTPVSAIVKPFWTLDILVAAFIGALLSIFYVFLREYSRVK